MADTLCCQHWNLVMTTAEEHFRNDAKSSSVPYSPSWFIMADLTLWQP